MNRGLKTVLFVATLALVIGFAGQADAQRSREISLIGKINLKAVLLLHPAMANYDPAKQAFKVDISKNPQLQQQKASQHQGEIDSLNSQIKSIQGKIQELRRNNDRQMQALSTKYLGGIEKLDPGKAGMQKQQYLIDSSRSEASFSAKLQALFGQLSLAEERLSRLTKIAYHVGYTDPDETTRRFFAIFNEVKQYTQQLATAKNVQVVLNSSLSSSLKLDARQQNIVMPPELDYSKVFNVPFPRNLAGDEAAISGYYTNLASMANNWLMHGDKILDPFKASILDNDVFIGGVDLTNEVIMSIFRAYKIDPNIGNAIIQGITLN